MPLTMSKLKEDFLEVKKELPVPRKSRVRRGDDNTATPLKLLLFGDWGTGKTYSAIGLLRHGYKVLFVTSDIGGSGLSTIKLYIKNVLKQPELLENFYEIVITNDDEMQMFVEDPSKFFPEIYDIDFDFLFWDGFAGWQQSHLKDKIGEMALESSNSNRELKPAVAAGLHFEMTQWGMLTSSTIRTLDKFCGLNNKKTGKIWHKVVTAQEGVKSKEGKQGLYETKEPLLQGAGGVLSGAAFDLIIRTKKKFVISDKETIEQFEYQIKSENKKTKNRGFVLNNTEIGDMYLLWEKLREQAGIPKKLL